MSKKEATTSGRTGRGRTVLNFSSLSGRFCRLNQQQNLTRVCSWCRPKLLQNEIPVFYLNARPRAGGSPMMQGDVQMFTRYLAQSEFQDCWQHGGCWIRQREETCPSLEDRYGVTRLWEFPWLKIRHSLCFADTDNKERERNMVIMR